LEKSPPRGTKLPAACSGSKVRMEPGRDGRDPFNRSHQFDREESEDRSDQPQAGNGRERPAEVKTPQAEPRDGMAQQRIKQSSQKSGCQCDQSGMESKTPGSVRE